MKGKPGPNGILLLILAGVLWSLNAPLVKFIQLDSFILTGVRSLIAGTALLPMLRLKRIHWNKYMPLLFVCHTALCVCLVSALKLTSAPIAVGTQFTAPVWIYLVERKKGDRLHLKRIWPLLALLAGIGLFMCSSGEGVTLKGNLLALVTSFAFAGITLFSKRCMDENTLGMTSLMNLFTATVVFGLLIEAPFARLAAITPEQWPLLLILGIFQTGGGYSLYYMGLKYAKPSTAAMISPVEMVLGPLWVALFLREYPDAVALAGFVLVLVGVFGEVYAGHREHGDTQARKGS